MESLEKRLHKVELQLAQSISVNALAGCADERKLNGWSRFNKEYFYCLESEGIKYYPNESINRDLRLDVDYRTSQQLIDKASDLIDALNVLEVRCRISDNSLNISDSNFVEIENGEIVVISFKGKS